MLENAGEHPPSSPRVASYLIASGMVPLHTVCFMLLGPFCTPTVIDPIFRLPCDDPLTTRTFSSSASQSHFIWLIPNHARAPRHSALGSFNPGLKLDLFRSRSEAKIMLTIRCDTVQAPAFAVVRHTVRLSFLLFFPQLICHVS